MRSSGQEQGGSTPQMSAEAAPGGHKRPRPFDPAELLSRLWRQNLPLMRERVLSLEKAAGGARKGALSAEERTQASDLAHKLAGSLGMFGYPQGTDIAREIEAMLESEGPVDPEQLAGLAAALRSVLPL